MSLMFRFMLSLCLLLFGAFAHPCSHHSTDLQKADLSALHNDEALVGNAPAPGKRTTNDGTCALEIEEDEDSVPSRKEVKPGNRVFNLFYTLAHNGNCQKTGTVFSANFSRISSPAFIVNCVIRI